MIDGRSAFLDVETTGADPRADRITEVGVVLVDDGEVVEEWSSLVNPGRHIPAGIESLTGISDAMVTQAPTFPEIATDLAGWLDGRLLIAHNARFDYAFLRNEFQRAEVCFRSRVLCTVRLSRRLFPGQRRHNLDALIERFRLPCEARHRALPDARLIYRFSRALRSSLGTDALRCALEALVDVQHGSPELDEAPDTPGVYLLYDPQGAPLFVGKAVNLRSRLLGHLSERGQHAQQQREAVQAGALEWIPTAGDLGAALRQLRLLEKLAPAHNRRPRQGREAWALRWPLEAPQGQVGTIDLNAVDSASLGDWYGPFRSRADALSALRGLAREHRLCPTILGLESSSPCSAHATGSCKGACVGQENRAAHTLRLAHALLRLRMPAWPYRAAVAIVEQDAAHTRAELHVARGWRYLGSARSPAELPELMEDARALPPFDVDVYRLLKRAFDDARRFDVIDLSVAPLRIAWPL